MSASISVVMTTYNGKKYVKRQLDSIASQSRKPDEVLIFDDCSTDGTADLINEYINSNQLSNWKVIRNETNLGWRANFAKAINMANADYIFLSDQDDIWDNGKIEEMALVLDNDNHVNVLACNIRPVYESDKVPHITTAIGKYGKNMLEKVVLSGKTIAPIRPGCAYAFRKCIVDDFNKLWFPKCSHDSAIWTIGLLRGSLFIYNKELHSFYRNADNNTPFVARDSSQGRVDYLLLRAEIALRATECLEDIEATKKTWLARYAKVTKARADYLKNGHMRTLAYLVLHLSYYPKFASLIGDVYASNKAGERRTL